jgi:hypothetical protein
MDKKCLFYAASQWFCVPDMFGHKMAIFKEGPGIKGEFTVCVHKGFKI